MDRDTVIEITNLKKKYKLGTIGGGTLRGEIESRLALRRGREDPNAVIGAAANYGKEFWALDGIDLTVKRGERLGILGHNGAGKSTMLKLLSRITAPTEGEIRIRGRIASMLEVGTGFHGELTGRENIYLNAAILGMKPGEVENKLEEIITFSECREFIDTPVKRYSSGMFVKLAFAVAAHLDAEIMIMDEVLAVGDVHFQEKCLEKMRRLACDEERTVLYVSHNMSTIRKLCNRCLVLDKGKAIYIGNVEKGIAVYCQNNMKSKLIYFTKEGKNISDIDLELQRENSFDRKDFMKTILRIKSLVSFNDIYIRYEIKRVDGEKVGLFFSRTIEIGKDKENKYEFKFSLKHLAEGKYYITVVIFKVSGGKYEDLALLYKSSDFYIEKDGRNYCGIEWSPAWGAYFGYLQ